MKRHHIYSLMLSAVAVAGTMFISSCSDYDFMSEEEINLAEAEKEYTNYFFAQYGTPDPNHTWGFGELKAYNPGMSTRAGTVVVERNMWADRDNNGYKNDALAKQVTIPGWPNVDGYYYSDHSGDQDFQGAYNPMPASNDIYRPIGDVTEYEIQYVSAWFRTHKIENPEDYRLNLHLSDFFVQNVSADNDQWSYGTPSKGVTGNNGEDVTYVDKNTVNSLPNVTLKGETKNYQMKYNLDHLCFKPIGGSKTVDDTWTHLNNYNAQQNNWHPEDNEFQNIKRTFMYVTSSGTEDFACHPSETTESDYIYDWVLIRLTWMETMADGQLHQREGYYLAFDYAGEKAEVKVEGDHYYSNWIIKITPANFSPLSDSKRIMCEDLGNTYDFDFNDVVFDVRYERTAGSWDGDPNSKFDAIISLQAAGGTLPIYVGMNPTNNEEYEAHNMLGKTTTSLTPINVIDGGLVRGTSIYRVKDVTSTDPDDIPIYVKYKDGSIRTVNKANRGNLENKDGGYNPGPYKPQNPITESTAPQKFAVPITVKWMKECEFIEDGYPWFKNWVQNAEFKTDAGTDWYSITQNEHKIYTWNIVPDDNQPTGSSLWSGDASTNLLTPMALSDVTTKFEDAKGGLVIKGYDGADAIWKKIDAGNYSKVVFTIVYAADAPFTGKLIPMQGNGTQFNDKQYNEVSSTKQMAQRRYTHRFEFSKDELYKNETGYCDYLILYLSNDVTIENWYCTYKN